MMIMTAKVDLKKIILIVAAVAILILSIILAAGRSDADATPTGMPSPAGNDGRIQFLSSFGWDVESTPTQSGQVKIPENPDAVFDRYNTMQKGQGYDLSRYAGKNVMRYVYSVNNYPGATAPVYATVLVYENQVIGGDVTDTGPNGKIRGFKMPESYASSPTTTGTAAESLPGST